MNSSLTKKNHKGTVIAIISCVVFLGLIILLENLGQFFPDVKILKPTSMLFTVLKKGAVYSLIAVSMNLLNGFTGLFSLGHAGFMLLGAYTYAILTVPMNMKDSVYYLYGGSSVGFSMQGIFENIFGAEGVGGAVSMIIGVVISMICAGLVAALFAFLIGLPVLRLKSDYLAIATLGFAEIIRAVFQWDKLGRVTNGANMLKSFPIFTSFNIKGSDGKVALYLSTFVPFLVAILCITAIVLLINSTYGRAFKAIRDDEIAAEAMGINLAKHKMMSFCISAFFTGIGGALFAMYTTNAQAKPFTSALTYEILLIVVIGGIGSVTGSCIGAMLYVACSEWWLRFLDSAMTVGEIKIPFMGELGNYVPALNGVQMPLLKNGFRMVVFSVVIMIVVLFFRRGIMGTKELPDLFKRNGKKEKKVKKVKEGKGNNG